MWLYNGQLVPRYELVEPPDGQWGVVDDSGNWSGIVGMLQHERADFSFCLTTTSPRMRVMDHSRIYTHDPLVIISLKPQPLPQYLSIIRPLSGESHGHSKPIAWFSKELAGVINIPYVKPS